MRRSGRLGLRAAAITALAVALVAGCGSAPEETRDVSVVNRAAKTKKLTIGIAYDQPGLSERVGEGKIEGFDVDVAEYVARELGVQADNITWKETRAGEREKAIMDGSVDLVVTTFSITEERKTRIAFAGPYFIAGQGLLVRLNTSDITGPESLNGKKLCTVPNTTSAQTIKDRFAKSTQLVEYFRYSECISALLLGNVDAVTTDDVILAGYAAQNPELLKVVGKPFNPERYGIGLAKDDVSGKGKVNSAIEKMISSGEWKKSLDKHVGPSGYPVPTPPEVNER
ncbi:glutamate ABC transporter substrate-binding protein [Crossiella sp. CA-258035]|uniref:glutamate ABC transporter substrate-binding protein n=1 Tax=Crossiella sp. CA-258035 TaxID=2981138 RepID=UPI0024BCB849|nr:glutamate ABC transporter substrate-binding protein [Crossiella sp. CA-258035]WHT22087.1 glutamate ABC transporter substrate-binding protein [Crossiella sp. CA-258035]